MRASDFVNTPDFLALGPEEQRDAIRSFLNDTAVQFFNESPQRDTRSKITALVGFLHSEWYQAHIESILSRVGIHLKRHEILNKLCAAEHAGLSDEKLGAIFRAEYAKNGG